MNTKSFHLSQNKVGSLSECVLESNAVLMCPACFHIVKVKQSGTISASNANEDEYVDLLVTPRYHLDCPECHCQHDFIPIDSMLDNIIPGLNKLGYLTEMSCNSHSDESIQNMFIKFKQEYRFGYLPVGFAMDGVFLKPTDLSMTRGIAIAKLESWVDQLGGSIVSRLLDKATGDR